MSGGISQGPIKASGEVSNSTEKAVSFSDHYQSHKIESLHRKILVFKELFLDISKVSGKPSYLLLDDLYYIRPSDQAMVVDYFHRATKGTNTWLKIGTIIWRAACRNEAGG
jgi:hypothetical protein